MARLPEGHNPFEYHKPSADEVTRIEEVRKAFFEAYQAVIQNTRQGPVSGRYVSLCKTAMEQSCQWAVKSIVFETENADCAEG